MKLRWKIIGGLVLIVVIALVLASRSKTSEQVAAEATRNQLRQEGFKTELSEFDFSTTPELRARATALTNTDLRSSLRRQTILQEGAPELLAMVGPDTAEIVWSKPSLPGFRGEDLWPRLEEAFNEQRQALDAACAAALSGPIKFELTASNGIAMLLRHLPAMKGSAQTLGTRAMLEMTANHRDAAWTNLLGATRLVTAYEPEPSDVSHMVRLGCVTTVYETTWQLLQAGGWSDARLAALQKEWETLDFFKSLPDTAAFSRASTVAACEMERRQPAFEGVTLKELFHSPRNTLPMLVANLRRVRYHSRGSYEDEKNLLLYYRDRELELRQAVQAHSWAEMRQLPGVTNAVPFQYKSPSRIGALLSSRQMITAMQGRGLGLLARAAEAETRRRLLITAIAIERFRSRHAMVPVTLSDLSPEFLKSIPVDFMDGQPLRYRAGPDGHYVLYSVGLDCTDNGGKVEPPEAGEGPIAAMQAMRRRYGAYGPGGPFGVQMNADLVWPRPASASEVQARNDETERAAQKRADEEEKARAEERAQIMAELEQNALNPKPVPERLFQGKALSKLLRNAESAGTNSPTLHEMLSLRPVTTGQEPDIVSFELPIKYDALTNLGGLQLLIDSAPGRDVESEAGEMQGCERATNGNCRLSWNTTYDPAGKHFLQAHLICATDNDSDDLEVQGPLTTYFSSNICQFDPALSSMDEKGVTLYAKLAESVGNYTIELKSLDGVIVKTLTGSTSNSVIKVHWDLICEKGQRYTNDSVDSVFHVSLPGSGRSQTLKGP